MLNVEAVDLHYGAAQALRKVSLSATGGKRHLPKRLGGAIMEVDGFDVQHDFRFLHRPR